MAVAKEGRVMTSELQWEGFASVADPWILEALYAAGTDCTISGQQAASAESLAFDDDLRDQPFP